MATKKKCKWEAEKVFTKVWGSSQTLRGKSTLTQAIIENALTQPLLESGISSMLKIALWQESINP
jgi:hypothetical protein